MDDNQGVDGEIIDEDSILFRDDCTQMCVGDSQQATQQSQESASNGPDWPIQNTILNTWGTLRLRGDQQEYNLTHREVDGVRDSYTVGRRRCDIVVKDKRVSSQHCRIYCDYESARLKVF